MNIKVKMGNLDPVSGKKVSKRVLKAGIDEGDLDTLLNTLSKRHPDLAPILEDATHQEDLEICINDAPVPTESQEIHLQEGDTVSLFLKLP